MEDDPSYEIEVTRETQPGSLSDSQIRQAVELALHRHDCPRAALAIALTDDARIAELNGRYLGQRGPTDVLAFDLADGDGQALDGQIAVSVETARRQARRRGHSIEAEVLLYCVHGTLHLLGYDDAASDQAKRMHQTEDQLLTELGVGAVYGGRAE